jgi:taurine transport system substrate-binding protein
VGPAKSKLLGAGGEVFKTYDMLEAAGYVIADVIIARTAVASADPGMITAMLKAFGKTLDTYKTSPDQAAAIVGKEIGVSAEVAKSDMADYDFVSFKDQLTPAWLGAPGGEGKFASVLKGTADFLVEQKSIRKSADVPVFAKAINTSYLAKAVGWRCLRRH